MTGQFEVDVQQAIEVFLAAIAEAAERAAIEVIHSAFARVSAGHAVAAASNEPPPAKEPKHRPMPARIDRAALRQRVIACLREHPGWDTAQVGVCLGVYPARIRRQLRELMNDGMIRSEERPFGFGALRRRTYFVVEPTIAAPAHIEPSGGTAEPLALSIEAMA